MCVIVPWRKSPVILCIPLVLLVRLLNATLIRRDFWIPVTKILIGWSKDLSHLWNCLFAVSCLDDEHAPCVESTAGLYFLFVFLCESVPSFTWSSYQWLIRLEEQDRQLHAKIDWPVFLMPSCFMPRIFANIPNVNIATVFQSICHTPLIYSVRLPMPVQVVGWGWTGNWCTSPTWRVLGMLTPWDGWGVPPLLAAVRSETHLTHL